MTLKISNRLVALAGAIAVVLTAFSYFGVTGVRTILAMFLFFFLPFYLLLRLLRMQEDERIFFAFFTGLGLFSTAVFFVGRVVPSFRVSVVIAFILLVVASVLLARKNKIKLF